jgi:hypothetical protein
MSAIGLLSIFLIIFWLIWKRRPTKPMQTPLIDTFFDAWTKHELPAVLVDKFKHAKELGSSAVHELEAEVVHSESRRGIPLVEADAEGASRN